VGEGLVGGGDGGGVRERVSGGWHG
jgi:hypothetical protein